MPPLISPEDIVDEIDLKDLVDAKRAKAQDSLLRTGSLPSWWELGMKVDVSRARKKFDSPDHFFQKGLGYFKGLAEYAAANEKPNEKPTLGGLCLEMGFTSRRDLEYFVRQRPEYREAHATLMTMLQMPLERALSQGASAPGLVFLLKNIPEGWLPTDPVDAPVTYTWKDKATQEVEVRGEILVTENTEKPEETYLAMLKAGARLGARRVFQGEEAEDAELVEDTKPPVPALEDKGDDPNLAPPLNFNYASILTPVLQEDSEDSEDSAESSEDKFGG